MSHKLLNITANSVRFSHSFTIFSHWWSSLSLPLFLAISKKAHPEVMLSWAWGAQDVDWKEADLLEINSFHWKKDWTGIQAIDSDMWCGRVLSWCAEQQAGSLSSSSGGKSSAWHHSSLFRMWVLCKNRLRTTIWLCVFACSLLHPSCMNINSFFGQRSFLTLNFFFF